jgi:hypothetical protein
VGDCGNYLSRWALGLNWMLGFVAFGLLADGRSLTGVGLPPPVDD